MNNFAGLKFFKPDSKLDQWGDPSKINRDLLLKLDQLRAQVGQPILVTSGYRTQGSTTDSQHTVGRAVDVMCPGVLLLDFYLAAERFGFSGIGVYPHWQVGGVKHGGLHLDVRTGDPARWMGVLQFGKQQYVALNKQNLIGYGVI